MVLESQSAINKVSLLSVDVLFLALKKKTNQPPSVIHQNQ